MSPTKAMLSRASMCFPRVSGDEPMRVIEFVGHWTFSPRERG